MMDSGTFFFNFDLFFSWERQDAENIQWYLLKMPSFLFFVFLRDLVLSIFWMAKIQTVVLYSLPEQMKLGGGSVSMTRVNCTILEK